MVSPLYTDLSEPGAIIAKRREEVGLTQTDVSQSLGYANPNFISMMERGKCRVPIDRCAEFAAVLEMDVHWFAEKILRNHHPAFAELIFVQ